MRKRAMANRPNQPERPNPSDRASLRLALPSLGALSGHAARPQVGAEAGLEFGDGVQVGPDESVHDGRDGRVVDAAGRFGSPEAHAVHRKREIESELPCGLNGGVSAGSSGPVGDELSGGGPSGTRHVNSVEADLLNCVSSAGEQRAAVARPAASTYTGGSNRHQVRRAVEKVIDAYKPTIPAAKWEAIALFVREAIRDCDAKTPYSARDLLAATTPFVGWCTETAGLELDRETIFLHGVIGEYIARGCPQMSPASAGNRRSQLLRVAEALRIPQRGVERLAPLPPSNALSPYSAQELVSLCSWAQGQNTQYRRVHAHLLLSLGLGAGLSNAEILAVQSRHLHVDSEGILIEVEGRRSRMIPLLAAWEQPLLDYSQARPVNPRQFIFRPLANGEGRSARNSNTIGNFVDQTKPPTVKPTAQRMRVTWIVTHLSAGTPLKPLIVAAGVDSLEALTRYLQFIPGSDLAAVRARFRSASTGIEDA